VTTEQESKLPAAAAVAGGGEDDAAALVAGALVAGALGEETGVGEDDEVQAASERAAQLTMTRIATDRSRI
jgi:hypothetical protein